MKYFVKRTSGPSSWDIDELKEKKPCAEAVWEPYSYLHRYKDIDGVEREKQIEGEGWQVEIASLEELEGFCAKYGIIVFNGSEIEIYDDYRE